MAKDLKNLQDSHDHHDPLNTKTSPSVDKGIPPGKVSNVSSGNSM